MSSKGSLNPVPRDIRNMVLYCIWEYQSLTIILYEMMDKTAYTPWINSYDIPAV